MPSSPRAMRVPAIVRVITGLVVGAAVAAVIPGPDEWIARVLVGWVAFTLTLGGFLVPLLRADADATARIAVTDDDTRAFSRTFSLTAATVSLVGVGVVLHQANARDADGATALLIIGLATVVASWVLLHLEYTLHYAHRYYADGGGVTFPTEPMSADERPDLRDFAYLAFTLGMTFQVSDTSITTQRMRRQVLAHCLLSYLFSVAIIAVVINAVASFVR